jgi:hypothetical protein
MTTQPATLLPLSDKGQQRSAAKPSLLIALLLIIALVGSVWWLLLRPGGGAANGQQESERRSVRLLSVNEWGFGTNERAEIPVRVAVPPGTTLEVQALSQTSAAKPAPLFVATNTVRGVQVVPVVSSPTAVPGRWPPASARAVQVRGRDLAGIRWTSDHIILRVRGRSTRLGFVASESCSGVRESPRP